MLFVISETTPNSNSSSNSWPLKMGQIGCPETSVNNYQYTLCNISKERRFIFQSSLPVQFMRSNVYSVIHAQIYPNSDIWLCCWTFSSGWIPTSQRTQKPWKRSVTHSHQRPSAVRGLTPSPWSDPFPLNRFWLYLARQTPWSSLNYCQNFKLVFIFPGELWVPPAEKHSDTFFCIQIYTYYRVRCNWRFHLSPTGGSSGVCLLPNWISYLIYISYPVIISYSKGYRFDCWPGALVSCMQVDAPDIRPQPFWTTINSRYCIVFSLHLLE